jgi:hypothetical protein
MHDPGLNRSDNPNFRQPLAIGVASPAPVVTIPFGECDRRWTMRSSAPHELSLARRAMRVWRLVDARPSCRVRSKSRCWRCRSSRPMQDRRPAILHMRACLRPIAMSTAAASCVDLVLERSTEPVRPNANPSLRRRRRRTGWSALRPARSAARRSSASRRSGAGTVSASASVPTWPSATMSISASPRHAARGVGVASMLTCVNVSPRAVGTHAGAALRRTEPPSRRWRPCSASC